MASLQDSDPRHVGAYRLIERLAVGGMGIVYLGESQSGRKVAVKLIRLEQAGEPEFRARFRHEVPNVLVGIGKCRRTKSWRTHRKTEETFISHRTLTFIFRPF